MIRMSIAKAQAKACQIAVFILGRKRYVIAVAVAITKQDIKTMSLLL